MLDDEAVEPVETAAQIHRGSRHQHPRLPRHTQHGSACNSWDTVLTLETSCSLTVQPLGLTTSTGQGEVALGNNSSRNMADGSPDTRSNRSHFQRFLCLPRLRNQPH